MMNTNHNDIRHQSSPHGGGWGRGFLSIAVFLVVIGFVWYMVSSVKEEERVSVNARPETAKSFTSPYERESSFDLPEEISRFELYNDQLLIAAGQSIYVYDTAGVQLRRFPVKPGVRDITAAGDNIYLLYPTDIAVYSHQGEKIRGWEACSDLSDYCSFTLAGECVFVTDAANKNICKYTNEGGFVKFIDSPVGFIIPSYSFDIESRDDTVYCVNAGRQLVEIYTPAGEFVSAFGGPGGESGFFAGCCNPSYITFTPDGKLIASEKGNPRISLYERAGTFRNVLLNSRLLGGGTNAYQVKASNRKLFVAGKNTIIVYENKSRKYSRSTGQTCGNSANAIVRRHSAMFRAAPVLSRNSDDTFHDKVLCSPPAR